MEHEHALSEIRAAMETYKKSEELLKTYQLDFITEETSKSLDRMKKAEKAGEILAEVLSVSAVPQILALVSSTTSTEEVKQSQVKKLEKSLFHLRGSQKNLENALVNLFKSWEAYVAAEHDEAIKRAQESQNLVNDAVESGLVGIAKEYLRRAEIKASTGKKILAQVKDARKCLDVAKLKFAAYENKPVNQSSAETRLVLEAAVNEAKKAAIEAQYAIDDAKLRFLITVVTVSLAVFAATWTLYNILKLFSLI